MRQIWNNIFERKEPFGVMATSIVRLAMPVKRPFVTLLPIKAKRQRFIHEAEDLVVFSPSFNKIFAMRHRFDGYMSMWCKARPGAQDVLVGSEPERFFVPPYVGHHSWIGVWLDAEIGWELVADLVEESYRMTAPKRLSALLDRG